MSDTVSGLPVHGYRDQKQEAIQTVNNFKQLEERLLRTLDEMAKETGPRPGNSGPPGLYDGRWLAIGRTQIEQAFMAINRAVFQPSRVKLPEDEA